MKVQKTVVSKLVFCVFLATKFPVVRKIKQKHKHKKKKNNVNFLMSLSKHFFKYYVLKKEILCFEIHNISCLNCSIISGICIF